MQIVYFLQWTCSCVGVRVHVYELKPVFKLVLPVQSYFIRPWYWMAVNSKSMKGCLQWFLSCLAWEKPTARRVYLACLVGPSRGQFSHKEFHFKKVLSSCLPVENITETP